MPESQNIEYKSSWHEEYLDWVCGFANAQGGKIYIGKDNKALQKKFAVQAIVSVEKQNALLARRAFISIENTSNTKSQYAVGV